MKHQSPSASFSLFSSVPTKRRCASLLLSAVVLTCACSSKEQGDDSASKGPGEGSGGGGDAVAYLGSEPITRQEVEEAAASELMQVDQQRYEILKNTLDRVTFQKLADKEAAARGITAEQLFAAEIRDKLQPPTEQEIQAFADANKAAIGNQPFEQVRPRIVQELTNRKQQARLRDFLDELKAKTEVRVTLEPPRMTVQVPEGEPAKGPETAPVTIVEFADFDCAFCKRTHPTLQRLLSAYGDRVRFVFRDYPLPMHPRAMPASVAARCAGEQDKYWNYYDNLMGVQGDLSDEDLKKRAQDVGLDVNSFAACYAEQRHRDKVLKGMEDGRKLGVTGTPTFFINGRPLVGAPAYEQLQGIVDEELARAS
jgi:protein-disulfide isomerase